MADEEYRPSFPGHVLDLVDALFLKLGISDREHFVDDENFRLEVSRHGEGQPDLHAARVALHWCVDEPPDT